MHTNCIKTYIPLNLCVTEFVWIVLLRGSQTGIQSLLLRQVVSVELRESQCVITGNVQTQASSFQTADVVFFAVFTGKENSVILN